MEHTESQLLIIHAQLAMQTFQIHQNEMLTQEQKATQIFEATETALKQAYELGLDPHRNMKEDL